MSTKILSHIDSDNFGVGEFCQRIWFEAEYIDDMLAGTVLCWTEENKDKKVINFNELTKTDQDKIFKLIKDCL